MVSVSEETMQTTSQLRPLIASVSFSRLDLRYQAPTANLEGNFALGTKGLGRGGGEVVVRLPNTAIVVFGNLQNACLVPAISWLYSYFSSS